MFQFPGLAPDGLYIHPPVTPSGCPVTPGFPIRRSPDQCVFDHSPGHIAAYHVLHRLSTPRHPPCTLSNLTTLMRGCHAPAKAEYLPRLRPASFVRSNTFQRTRFPTVLASRSARRPSRSHTTTWNLWFVHIHLICPVASNPSPRDHRSPTDPRPLLQLSKSMNSKLRLPTSIGSRAEPCNLA